MRSAFLIPGQVAALALTLLACGGGDDDGGITLVDAPPAPVAWDYGPGAASVVATDFSLVVGGAANLVLRGAGVADVTGSGFTPGTNDGTLEVEWTENANTMRLYFYFTRSGGRWHVSQIQHWDGAPTPSWIFYDGPFFDSPEGQPFTGDIDLGPAAGGSSLHFRGLTVTAFARELPLP
ncbi:MAG: hypothetical protein HS111_30560 [Kofleriaceae bacterium]|nr:hypothetical protein [Kofleriaceae bacterium]MCL4228330.1 hypothetical protein [Myxococcales bacterium]